MLQAGFEVHISPGRRIPKGMVLAWPRLARSALCSSAIRSRKVLVGAPMMRNCEQRSRRSNPLPVQYKVRTYRQRVRYWTRLGVIDTYPEAIMQSCIDALPSCIAFVTSVSPLESLVIQYSRLPALPATGTSKTCIGDNR